VGEAIRKGKSVDKLVSVLDQVMSKRQHINDVDLLIILREV
jgi:urease gamma subunit